MTGPQRVQLRPCLVVRVACGAQAGHRHKWRMRHKLAQPQKFGS